MFICLNCNATFEKPICWEESHGLDSPPYEKMSASPCCNDSYTNANACDCCGEFITDKYIKIGHDRYCQDCYETFEIGDED